MYAETLNIRGLARTRLAKSVHDAGWAAFVGMLESKANRYGRVFTKVPRTFASSQICSTCGHRDGPKPLHVRAWSCTACGTRHDRDHNAAINILHEGQRINSNRSNVAAGRQAAPAMGREAETLNACGDQVRPPFAVAQVVEPGTHQKPMAARSATGRLESPPLRARRTSKTPEFPVESPSPRMAIRKEPGEGTWTSTRSRCSNGS